MVRRGVGKHQVPKATQHQEERMKLTKRIERDVKQLASGLSSGLVTIVVAVALLSIGCATIGTASPWEVRAEDLRINSRIAYERVMNIHYALSTQENPELYKALETLRVEFPKHHREYVATLKTIQAAKGRDPDALRENGLKLLDALALYGSADWKATVGALRLAFEGR